MGEQSVSVKEDQAQRKRFLANLLNDVKALEHVIDNGLIETGIKRVGAEQEFCLMDQRWNPAPLAMEFLEKINDDHFTTELARFNLEINLDPQEFTGDCFTKMENQLNELLAKAEALAGEMDSKVILAGILPTIRKADLHNGNLTPLPRYIALSQIMHRLRGEDFDFNISGADELITRHNSILFESCNTSFQVHLQVEPDNFTYLYNWAQAIYGPIDGNLDQFTFITWEKRLWHETRIALFHQSTDVRSGSTTMREMSPRVWFGDDWITGSIVDIFKEDIARHKLLLSSENVANSFDLINQGKVPKLDALRMHNGTIYKWNRPCYGLTTPKLAHLRIENRIFPSGPSAIDEMANAAFWVGIMNGIPDEYKNLTDRLDFEDARENFFKAAQNGMGANFTWMDEKRISASDLLLKEMIPLAKEGLEKAGIDPVDSDKYLSIIQERAETQKTGAQWALDSFNYLRKRGTKEGAIVGTTAATYHRQQSGGPVHTWKRAQEHESGQWMNKYLYVSQLMAKDLITVFEDDLLSLVTNIMDWRKIRHIPVENERNELVGLITSGVLIHHYAKNPNQNLDEITVKEVMVRNPITVSPQTLTKNALNMMREKKIGCLPVTEDNKLAGIVTEYDFIDMAMHLFNNEK